MPRGGVLTALEGAAAPLIFADGFFSALAFEGTGGSAMSAKSAAPPARTYTIKHTRVSNNLSTASSLARVHPECNFVLSSKL